MHDLGLRRGEVVALDLADLDFDAGTVAIVGKGKSEKMNVTLNAPTAALPDWVEAQGEWSGALFVRLDRAAGPGHPTRLDAGNAARASKSLIGGILAGLVTTLFVVPSLYSLVVKDHPSRVDPDDGSDLSGSGPFD
jgi:integrase